MPFAGLRRTPLDCPDYCATEDTRLRNRVATPDLLAPKQQRCSHALTGIRPATFSHHSADFSSPPMEGITYFFQICSLDLLVPPHTVIDQFRQPSQLISLCEFCHIVCRPHKPTVHGVLFRLLWIPDAGSIILAAASTCPAGFLVRILLRCHQGRNHIASRLSSESCGSLFLGHSRRGGIPVFTELRWTYKSIFSCKNQMSFPRLSPCSAHNGGGGRTRTHTPYHYGLSVFKTAPLTIWVRLRLPPSLV